MNVSELARKLRTTTNELFEILPAVGFDIGRRAIKIDDRQAKRILEQWPRLLSRYKAQLAEAAEAEIKAKNGPVQEAPKEPVAIPQLITVKDFAIKLKMPLPKVMGELMKNGVLSSMNERIDFDTASIVGQELGYEIIPEASTDEKKEQTSSEKLEGLLAESDASKLQERPPVVVVMGHVDHGKTKLLDAIRTTNVVEGESGGITQHIGAYQVEKKGKKITFIDTPGHEAFTTMRSRGARVADIAILVIAADDSIQPQTKESIKIIKSAQLPMIVAINKIDKPEANQEKVKQDLAALGLTPEEWGGDTICVPISAKQGTGIDDLLEMILLVAETEKDEIRANPNKAAVGTIIESHVDKGQGPVATVLIQNGTLKRGDLITVGDIFYGKIKSMKNYLGNNVDQATPSMPIEISGLKANASIGDVLQVTDTVERKNRIKTYDLKNQATAYTKPVEINKEKIAAGVKALNVIIKADVLGSLEAVISSLLQIENPEVSVNIIDKGLGNINDNDVERAITANAIVFGFNVKPTQTAERLAQDKKVEIKIYEVIYHLLEDVKKRLEEMLSPEVIRTDFGRVKVLAIFKQEKNLMVIGGSVTKDKAVNNAKVDVIRDKHKIATGSIVKLQMNKINVNEVSQGNECGIQYEGKPVIEVGDSLEVYQEEIKKKKL
ncbi:MAG: translation initiation factor IF-2 [Candidatus Buchananbacteria bacterium]|nr:translation initiation factor IF-2 [Candidatus Buchananbacteria bacterium]